MRERDRGAGHSLPHVHCGQDWSGRVYIEVCVCVCVCVCVRVCVWRERM